MSRASYARVNSNGGPVSGIEEHELATRNSEKAPHLPSHVESTTAGASPSNPVNGRPYRSVRAPSTSWYALLDFLIALPALYFLIFGFLVYARDKTALTSGPEDNNLIAAAKLNPTIFPIAFAAIVGRFLKSVAAWRLERDASILSLEQLLNSKTVVSAVVLPFKLRRLDVLSILLIILWAISPLGGQASQRVVSSAPLTAQNYANISYLDTNSWYIVSNGNSNGSYYPGASAAYMSALVPPLAIKGEGQDAFGNVKIPMLEYLEGSEDSENDAFKPITNDANVIWSSLLGVPLTSASNSSTSPGGALLPMVGSTNTTFNLESSYWSFNCAPPIHMPMPPNYGSSDVSLFSNFSNGSYPHTTTLDSGKMLIGLKKHTENSTDPRTIYVESMDSNGADHVECNMTTTYVESQVQCLGATCSVVGIRRSLSPLSSPNISMLDFSTDNIMETDKAFITNWLYLTPLSQESTSNDPNQVYLTDPEAPFFTQFAGAGPASPVELFNVDSVAIQQRLGQMLNTAWLATLAPNAITGNYTSQGTLPIPPYPYVENLPNGFATPDPFYYSRYSSANVQQSQLVLFCHRQWLGILVVSSLIMLFAGLSTIFLELARRGPDIFDSFSSLIRDSRYFAAQGHSTQDSSDLTREWAKKKVRLGDVAPEQQIGHIAIGMAAGNVQRLRKERLYD
ncbi:hypothetical protein EV356DRAFT_532010 [Viridothelium virens]|uniref:Uncharacterized protein n=1 Tax=Viridothelium virens TaxID=1048519 RepID=A0A6A6HAW0_VIRVR|nr:hypothetical protein EV356DRAFT_532010 [Viridothelium virens]